MPGLLTAKELRAKRAAIANKMNAILAEPKGENGAMSTEQRAEFERMDAEVETLGADVARIEKHEERMAAMGGSPGPRAGGQQDDEREEVEGLSEQALDLAEAAEERSGDGLRTDRNELRRLGRIIARGAKRTPQLHAAYDSYLRRGMAGLSVEHRGIMQARMSLLESRSMGTNSDTGGGYLVPEGFYGSVIEARLFYGGMRQSRATILPTASGQSLPIPTDNDTSNTGELVGENNPLGTQDVAFGQAMLNAYMYSSKIIKVSRQLLNDSAFPLQPYIARKFAQRLGRIQNTHFTTGDGASKPQGVVTGATSGVAATSGQTTSITYNDLVELEHSVDRY